MWYWLIICMHYRATVSDFSLMSCSLCLWFTGIFVFFYERIKMDGCVQVMGACFEIFSTWDDEYEKLQGLLRDIVKKKKEDMKLAWKVNPTHKRLQARLDQMRKWVVHLLLYCQLFLGHIANVLYLMSNVWCYISVVFLWAKCPKMQIYWSWGTDYCYCYCIHRVHLTYLVVKCC